LQTIVHRLGDLQLAMVLIRLYEAGDQEKQAVLLRELLCREVLRIDQSEIGVPASPDTEEYPKIAEGAKS
jgi:hypothetical protein